MDKPHKKHLVLRDKLRDDKDIYLGLIAALPDDSLDLLIEIYRSLDT